MSDDPDERSHFDREVTLAALRSHEQHMKHIYGLRWGGLMLAGLTIVTDAVMIFMGLQGTFDWAVQAPASIGAKLTNASPGIVFATIGMILGFKVVGQKPMNYLTGLGTILGSKSFKTPKEGESKYPPIIAPWGD